MSHLCRFVSVQTTKFCNTCQYYNSKKDEDFDSRVKRVDAHMEAGNCSINYEGAMEIKEVLQ